MYNIYYNPCVYMIYGMYNIYFGLLNKSFAALDVPPSGKTLLGKQYASICRRYCLASSIFPMCALVPTSCKKTSNLQTYIRPRFAPVFERCRFLGC